MVFYFEGIKPMRSTASDIRSIGIRWNSHDSGNFRIVLLSSLARKLKILDSNLSIRRFVLIFGISMTKDSSGDFKVVFGKVCLKRH